MNPLLIIIILYLLFCSYTDIKKRQIYIPPTLFIICLTLLFKIIYISFSLESLGLFLLSFIPGLIMLLISYITRENIGYGDSILLGLCSLCVGIWNGFFIIMTSFIYSAIFSLFLLIRGKNSKETIPFVPFIFLGTITYLIIGG